MTPAEALAWLDSTQQFGVKFGLENMRRLLAALDSPHEGAVCVHVAGTNGKGSVCAMIDAILRASGRRTGLYTSPHLVDFGERIRVDGRKIAPPCLAEGLTEIRRVSSCWEHSPTYFEIATALAFRHFARERCEVAVLETGMGGRLDATNVVQPVVSVLTPIALDHVQWLGGTVAQIAAEKAGIIKPGVPVVSCVQDAAAASVIAAAAAAAPAPLRVVDSPLAGVEVGLAGRNQRLNAAVAAVALEAAGLAVTGEALASGLRDVRWPGRFQVAGNIVLDGGHNPHAASQLVENWRDSRGSARADVIFGALADKDIPEMLRRLALIARRFLFVPVRSARSASTDQLARHCAAPFEVCETLESALTMAAGPTLITGSLFLVGEAMALLGLEP